jgi:hypothetical protein
MMEENKTQDDSKIIESPEQDTSIESVTSGSSLDTSHNKEIRSTQKAPFFDRCTVVAVILSISLALCIIIPGYLYFTDERRGVVAVQRFDNQKKFDQEYKQEFIAELSKSIEESSNEYQKNALSLQKAFMQSLLRTSGIDSKEREESRFIMRTVYANTKDKEVYQYKRLNEYAVFGAVFSFVENCFMPSSVLSLDDSLIERYFPYHATQSDMSRIVLQKEAFKGFITILDDTNVFEMFNQDKSFNSYSMLIKAVYLDSYFDSLSDFEKKTLSESIQKDIFEFEKGAFISVGASSSRITLAAVRHKAFAQYVTGRVDGASSTEMFDKAYNTLSIAPADSITKGISQSLLLIFHIGILGRDQTIDLEKVGTLVSHLETIFKENPQVKPLIKGYLNYGTTQNGKWLSVKQDFFSLSEKSPKLRAFLVDLGVNGFK